METEPSTLALGGMFVLDLTQFMAGPYATMILADLGAEVLKVEPPLGGDQTRHALGNPGKGDDTLAFHAVNRNKKSVTLNLKSEEGRQIFYELAARADVMVENFRPGVAMRLGVDYDTMSAKNPRLIYASISGFGQTGPYAMRPGFDLIAQAMGGIMSVTGTPGGPPVKSGVPIADLGAGLFCSIGVIAAYASRGQTGRGQYLETSLLEATIALSVWEAAELWSTGKAPTALGSAHRLTSPYQALRARDGYLTLGAANDRLWKAACHALARPDLIDDPRFATNPARMQNVAELVLELEAAVGDRTVADCVDALLAAGVPAGPIYDYEQVFADEHVRARQMQQTVEHPIEGPVPSLGFPIKLSETPCQLRSPAPLLGQHTDDVLDALGYSPEARADLRRQGIL